MGINNRSSKLLDRSSTEAAQVVGLDPLSSVLRTVRLRGAVFFLWEVSSPLTTTVPRGERFAPVVLPGSQQIVSYHVIVEGACWGGLIGEPPIRLRTGDVLLVPRGDAYVMGTSAGACRQARVDEKEALGFFRLMATG
jgi:hypothetical protein